MTKTVKTSNGPQVGRRSFLGMTAVAAGALAGGGRAVPALAQGKPGPRMANLERSPVVETALGRVQGTYDGTVYAFKGVPYAASTGGANRFQPPQARQPWQGIRDTVELGLRCAAPQSTAQAEYVVMDRREPAGEDCLCLNLWTNGLGKGKRPVMLWLHGGGYRVGSAGHTVYDGTNLAAKQDVVFVAANHRVNLWGYLHLSETGLGRFAESSNMGMLDIVAALEWIKANIAQFGGDPDNVTVIGQSGGGGKTSTLLGMPAAQGLYHRVVVMSGSEVRSQTKADAAETVERALAALNLNLNQAERLLDMPYYHLREKLGSGPYRYAPLMDGQTIPQHVFDPVAPAMSAGVPMLIGSTETEMTWNVQQHYDPLDEAALLDYARRALNASEAKTREVLSVYRKGRPDASNLDLYLILATDLSGFRTGTDIEAERKAALNKAPVYKYYFNWYSPADWGHLRSMHTMDIPFFLDNVEKARSLIGDGPELQGIADRISSAIVAFARTGDPNGGGRPKWDPFDARRRATMFLGDDMHQVDDPYREERLARMLV